MKKGYLKTIEVVIAAIITIIFALYILPNYTGSENLDKGLHVLSKLSWDETFRNEILLMHGCYNATDTPQLHEIIMKYLPQSYSYLLCLDETIREFPNKQVFRDTYFFTGNATNFNPMVVRLYYWLKRI